MPIVRTSTSRRAARTPGSRSGSSTWMKRRNVPAPKTRAAASMRGSICSTKGIMTRITKGTRRHEIGEDDARHRAAEPGPVEHGRHRDAVGDRRHEQRQEEEQHHELLAREIAPRHRIGGRHAEKPRERDDREHHLEGDDEHVVELELVPGREIPARREAGGQPGAEPPRREGGGDHRRDHGEEVDDEEADQHPERGRPQPFGERAVHAQASAFPAAAPGRDRTSERAGEARRPRRRAASPP